MSKNATNIKKRMLIGTIVAFIVAAFCAYFSRVEFIYALSSLLFSWPIADFIIENLSSKNNPLQNEKAEFEWWIPLLQICIVLGSGVAGVLGAKLKFLEALSISILVISPIGAFLGILAEWEDNEPGGFNNPHPKNDDESSDK
jgi:hypothetical protein